MRTVLIGYGYWGKIMEKYIRASTLFELDTIYDPSLDNTSSEEIFQDDSIQCVFVCSPVSTHFEIVFSALKAKKHVFCEKPLCKTTDECQLLMNLALENQVLLYTDLIYLVSDGINKLKHLMPKIGEITYVEADISQFGNFYKDSDVYEVIGIHMISAILYLLDIQFDDITHIFERNCYDLNKYSAFGIIHFLVDSVFVSIKSSLISHEKKREIKIYGKKGYLVFDMLSINTVNFVEMIEQESKFIYKENKFQYDEANNIDKALKDFHNKIAIKDTSNMDFALRTVQFLEKLRRE